MQGIYVLMTSQLKQLLSDYSEELHAARAEGLRKVWLHGVMHDNITW